MSMAVASTQGLTVDDVVYVGDLSREGCERVVVASVAGGTTVKLTAPLTHAHRAHKAVTSVLGDTSASTARLTWTAPHPT